jgi:hypothetical protein
MKNWKGKELSSVRFDDAVWGNATELIFEDGSIFSIIGVEPRKGSFSERAESFSDDFHSFVVTPSKPNRDAKNSVDISKKIQKIEILSLKSMNRSLDLCVNADLALVLFFDDGSLQLTRKATSYRGFLFSLVGTVGKNKNFLVFKNIRCCLMF